MKEEERREGGRQYREREEGGERLRMKEGEKGRK